MHFSLVSRFRYFHTMGWALLLSMLIVALAALLARATLRLNAALTTGKPDLALELLRPSDGIQDETLLRISNAGNRYDYFAHTKTGTRLYRVEKGPHQWYVSWVVDLHQ